ncbi:MAG TPA: GNAT family N-acetyltransferase [Solirubrobacterales bacterium]|nr:GNAT family N-acetyltransferase [Solirubrobacterales bacterium]
MDPTIRTAELADLPAVLALWRAADSIPSVTDSEAGLRTLLARDPEALLVVDAGREAGGGIVGTLIAAWDGWRGSFYRLAVRPERRRQGVAAALVRAGEERLARLGAVRITAIVADHEHAAVALWEAVGYVRQADRSRFVRELAG